MKKTPLQIVKERFEDKAKLIEALRKFTNEDLWVNRLNAEKGLELVSNAKLLRLFDTFSAVKEKFGNRFKLIDAIVSLENRVKDAGFRTRLEKFPVPRLFDMYKSAARRQARAEKKPAVKRPPTVQAEPKAKVVTKAKAAPKKTAPKKKSTKRG